MPPLHLQHLVPAPPTTKIRLALLSTALCDALGGPAEFHARSSFPFISQMQPNPTFGLRPGVWTDDTSMALALARSIARVPFDLGGIEDPGSRTGKALIPDVKAAAEQLDAYHRWWRNGELSAIDRCFDIGNTIRQALGTYQSELRAVGVTQSDAASAKTEQRRQAAAAALLRVAEDMSDPRFGGNGSLMRVVPVGLAYWHAGDDVVSECARRSSVTTHPNEVCVEACRVWSLCIAKVIRAAAAENASTKMTKLDVLHHFAAFPYATSALQTALAADSPPPASALGNAEATEAHYAQHHRLLRLAAETQQASSKSSSRKGTPESRAALAALPEAKYLPSSGYVVDTLVAALYAFLATDTFEVGALLTVNMGNDADTVAAVYGGLAGAWYGEEEHSGGVGGPFWSDKVRAWRDKLVRRNVVEEVGNELVEFAESTRR
ncbi:ADP-ribosylation/Crystallin J1 [Favolaschia claudopus]|uniref:ADP-ribosylhydrolase ARH3 n=1 Tax=Favolaschia claudopus TaxID=2862362 RepID=A0AAW0CYY1_9AGAR